jgi:hypothetical protein
MEQVGDAELSRVPDTKGQETAAVRSDGEK